MFYLKLVNKWEQTDSHYNPSYWPLKMLILAKNVPHNFTSFFSRRIEQIDRCVLKLNEWKIKGADEEGNSKRKSDTAQSC